MIGNQVAVKVFRGATVEKALEEVKIMCTLQHPRIIKLFACFLEEHQMGIVMEFAPLGELSAWIKGANWK